MSTYDGLDVWTETTTLPDDGPTNGRDAASVNTPLSTVLDRTRWLKNHRMVAVYQIGDDDDLGSVSEVFNTTSYVKSTTVYVDVTDVEVGDVLLIDLFFYGRFDSTTAGRYGKFRLYATDDHGGTPTAASMPGALVRLEGNNSTGLTLAQFHECSLVYAHTAAAAGTTRVGLQGLVTNAADSVTLDVAYLLRVQHVRI